MDKNENISRFLKIFLKVFLKVLQSFVFSSCVLAGIATDYSKTLFQRYPKNYFMTRNYVNKKSLHVSIWRFSGNCKSNSDIYIQLKQCQVRIQVVSPLCCLPSDWWLCSSLHKPNKDWMQSSSAHLILSRLDLRRGTLQKTRRKRGIHQGVIWFSKTPK